MDSSIKQQWSDLPAELLEKIGKCLDSPVDVLRFRSICTSWRSSVPPPSFDDESSRLYRLKLPHQPTTDAVLVPSTICRLDLLPHHDDRDSVSSRGWLTKVAESRSGKLELFNPLSNYKLRYSPIPLSLTSLRFVQLSRGFALRLLPGGGSSSVFGINKVVAYPENKNKISVLAICQEGKLVHWKDGDESWTLLDDNHFHYDDIIEFKGQLYVVDRWGTVSWIDSSLKVVQYSPPLYGCGGQKNLVESCGDLFVVDRYLDGERTTNEDDNSHAAAAAPAGHRRRRFRRSCVPKAVDFRVYKLDEEWGRWVDVRSLGDRVFVLGADCCFSVSAGDFIGGKGNCIYFTDDDDHNNYGGTGLSHDSIRVFRIEDGCIEKLGSVPEYSEMFWPPNYYINPSFSGSSSNMSS